MIQKTQSEDYISFAKDMHKLQHWEGVKSQTEINEKVNGIRNSSATRTCKITTIALAILGTLIILAAVPIIFFGAPVAVAGLTSLAGCLVLGLSASLLNAPIDHIYQVRKNGKSQLKEYKKLKMKYEEMQGDTIENLKNQKFTINNLLKDQDYFNMTSYEQISSNRPDKEFSDNDTEALNSYKELIENLIQDKESATNTTNF